MTNEVKYGSLKKLIIYIAADILISFSAGLLALLTRFDFSYQSIEAQYLSCFYTFCAAGFLFTIVSYHLGHLYSIIWSMASIHEAILIFMLNVLIVLLEMGTYVLFQRNMPRSFYLLSFIYQTGIEYIFRFFPSILKYTKLKIANTANKKNSSGPRIMIVGAGDAGSQLGKEILSQKHTDGNLVCYIDDDYKKARHLLDGVPILGNRWNITKICTQKKIDQIYIAIPSIDPKNRKEILEICHETGCRVKILPGIYQLANGDVSVSKLRSIKIEDLLGRESVKVNMDEIAASLRGQTILVTGGGGSIGSELCRQIAAFQPKLLIIFDIYENNAYSLQQELEKEYQSLNLLTLIGSVRNTNRIFQVMRDYRPDVVFHAAAHKHVPLMEISPNEAIKNNVYGTYQTAQAAAIYGAKRFILISTDKAVNPTNIMGASKRLCEMVVQMMNDTSPNTDFVAVRFGNVLGSNGSVVPLFMKQIQDGGPVTVTDKRIIRYFMTIPEAVNLILQTDVYAKGGEIFVLDMGEPIKILDLAEKMIHLAGFVPYKDIDIEFIGLRPGEKLYEEMLMNEEGLQDTENHLIHIGEPTSFNYKLFKEQLQELFSAAFEEKDGDTIKQMAAEILKTYKPQFQKNEHKNDFHEQLSDYQKRSLNFAKLYSPQIK